MSQCEMCIVCRALHSTQYTSHTAATPPNNNFTECLDINISLARLNCKLPDDGRRPKHVGAIQFYVNFYQSVTKCASVGE